MAINTRERLAIEPVDEDRFPHGLVRSLILSSVIGQVTDPEEVRARLVESELTDSVIGLGEVFTSRHMGCKRCQGSKFRVTVILPADCEVTENVMRKHSGARWKADPPAERYWVCVDCGSPVAAGG